MTEEVIVNEQQEVEQQQEQSTNKYEVLAQEQGWRPKEEWDGDPEDWRPAKEFVERGELFGKISHQNNELKELRKTLTYLADHHKKVKETEFQRAVGYLREQKVKALEDGDASKVVELDEAIAEVKDQAKQLKSSDNAQPNAPHPSFVQFVKNNAWYTTDQELRSFADEIGVGKKSTNPDIGPDELFAYVEKQVKRTFKDKFEKQPKVSMVEGSSGSSSKSSVKEYSLSDDERKVMNTFIRQGVMTKEEYIAELKASKGDK